MPPEILTNEGPRRQEIRELEGEERYLGEEVRRNLLRLFAVRYDLIRGMYDKLTTRDTGRVFAFTDGYTTSAPELDKEAKPELRGVTPNISYFVKTDYGGPRSKYPDRNEDAFFLNIKKRYDEKDPDEETMGIFDGVGGSGQGVLASRVAIASGLRNMTYGGDKILRDIAQHISRDINRYALGGSATGVIVYFEDTSRKLRAEWGGGRYINILAAGDTKALTIRNGAVLPEGTTVLDNSAFKYDKGRGDYYTAHNLNEITNSFGGGKPIEPQVLRFRAEENDVIVVATDALWDNVSEYEILELLKSSGPKFEEELYNLTYLRNNSETQFKIRHSAEKTIEKKLGAGDNITLGVMRMRK